MRHATLAKSLLLGSAIACAPTAAQEPEVTQADATQPTASVTIVAPPAPPAPPASTDSPVAEPTASTTLVIPAPVPTTIATGVPTTIATGVPTPAPGAVPTTVATGVPAPVPTTIATGVPTTIATGVPTTIATGVPSPPGTLPSAAATAAATASATLPPGAQPAMATIPAPAAPATGAVIDPDTYQKRTEFDNTPWRFNMEQNGKRMTADEFTAWMEARGVRVARGPQAHRPANPTRDGMGGQGSTLPTGVAPTATTTLIVAPQASAAPDALASGSVEPTDEWTDPDPVTTSATILVPVPPPAEPAPAQPIDEH